VFFKFVNLSNLIVPIICQYKLVGFLDVKYNDIHGMNMLTNTSVPSSYTDIVTTDHTNTCVCQVPILTL